MKMDYSIIDTLWNIFMAQGSYILRNVSGKYYYYYAT